MLIRKQLANKVCHVTRPTFLCCQKKMIFNKFNVFENMYVTLFLPFAILIALIAGEILYRQDLIWHPNKQPGKLPTKRWTEERSRFKSPIKINMSTEQPYMPDLLEVTLMSFFCRKLFLIISILWTFEGECRVEAKTKFSFELFWTCQTFQLLLLRICLFTVSLKH